jgi:hypothetical protein
LKKKLEFQAPSRQHDFLHKAHSIEVPDPLELTNQSRIKIVLSYDPSHVFDFLAAISARYLGEIVSEELGRIQ